MIPSDPEIPTAIRDGNVREVPAKGDQGRFSGQQSFPPLDGRERGASHPLLGSPEHGARGLSHRAGDSSHKPDSSHKGVEGPIARPPATGKPQPKFGNCQGMLKILVEDDEHLGDFEKSMP